MGDAARKAAAMLPMTSLTRVLSTRYAVILVGLLLLLALVSRIELADAQAAGVVNGCTGSLQSVVGADDEVVRPLVACS
jgi:uncharacterized membrane protein